MGNAVATVIIDGDDRRELAEDQYVVVGRADDEAAGVIGLDPADSGISRQAMAIGKIDRFWVVTNLSSKKALFLDTRGLGEMYRLAPGERFLLDTTPTLVEVRGALLRHKVEVHIPVEQLAIPSSPGAHSNSTMVSPPVSISENERDALAAVFVGYLRNWPARNCQPLSYNDAADLLNGRADAEPVRGSTVRKRVENVRAKVQRAGVWVDGSSAKQELADFMLDNGMLTWEDLARLE